ncbi:MAG: NAD-dependent epimerase/dehydratase family protein [Deltaproteobacteria bacterium]|nr:NAD-dependent epimerase/dehydratase family protein [Deltaproteobacteria bacterium]MBI3389745.1 NAD-dependent epimerase/dehydratase family protein [Deltaproteobacteria bacterium]
MKALVTGAAGFLGRHVVARLLAEGVGVRALVRNSAATVPAEAERVEVDLGNLDDDAALRGAVAGVDWVIHAAARVSTSGTWAEFDAANVSGTARLLHAATATGVKRVVHVSSLSVYAVPANGVTITEDSPYEAGAGERGFYSRSKLIADRLVMQAACGGAAVTLVRPGLLYGPGRRPPLARRAIPLGPLRFILGSPRYLLPMSYVENVADALLSAARAEGASGRAYTVVDANVPQVEYTERYRQAAGEHWRAVYIPAAPLMPMARAAELVFRLIGRSAPLTRHQLRRTTWSAYYDCGRAERELGWRPRVDLAEGLRRAFAVVD